MHRRADKDEDQGREHLAGDAEVRLHLPGIRGIAFGHPGKKSLAVLDVFGVRVDLIHQPVFFAVALCRPIGHLVDEPLNILRAGGGEPHEIVLHLAHAVGGGLHDQIVQRVEIGIQAGLGQAACVRQRLNPRSGQAVFRVAVEAGFHNFRLFSLKGLFVSFSHIILVLIG